MPKIETEASFNAKVVNFYTAEHFNTKKLNALLLKFELKTECGLDATIALEISEDYQPFGNPPKKYVDATIEEVQAVFGVDLKREGITGLEKVIGKTVGIYSKFSKKENEKTGEKFLNINFSRERKVDIKKANDLFNQLLSNSASTPAAEIDHTDIEAF